LVEVANLPAKIVTRVGQPGHQGGQRPAIGSLAAAMAHYYVRGHLEQLVDACVTEAKHVVLERGQAVHGGLAESVEPDHQYDVRGNGGHVQPYACRVRGHHGGRVIPAVGWSDVTAARRVTVRVSDERQRALGAGQRGRLVLTAVEHGADQRRERAHVPVGQLDDGEAVRLFETLPQRLAHVTGSLHEVVVYEERVQSHVRQPHGYYAWVELVSVPYGSQTNGKLHVLLSCSSIQK